MTSNQIQTGMPQAATLAMANQGTSSATAMPNNTATINLNNKPTATITNNSKNNITETTSTSILHQPTKSTSTTTTYNYLDSFARDPRELRLAKVKQYYNIEQESRIQIFKTRLAKLREEYKLSTPEIKTKIKELVTRSLNELIASELNSIETLENQMETVIDNKSMAKERGAAYTARMVSQEQAMNFLNKIAAIDRENSDDFFDITPQLNKELYAKTAAIAVGGMLSTKNANVMREALKQATNFNAEAEINSTINKESMTAGNDKTLDVVERLIDINYGALENNSMNHGEISTISTELMRFMNQIDYYRILSQKTDNPPIALTKVTEFYTKLEAKNKSLQENYEKVFKITKGLGLDTSLISNIGNEVTKLRAQVKQTLGTVFTEKQRDRTDVNEILLRQSHTGLTEIRRAMAKTALHALVMAYNRKFGNNQHYQQGENSNEPLWQKIAYDNINSKYQTGLSSSNPTEVKATEEALLREISVVANELRVNSQEPFRLYSFANNRKFEPELANLLKQCLHSTEPEQINMALSILSSVFSSTSAHTAHIFNRNENPKTRNKEQHEKDARAALWLFEMQFQNKLIKASQTKGFNQESLAKFFKDMMHTKSGDGSSPAITVLFNFIQCSMLPDKSATKSLDQEKNLQRAEKYALYLYYLVMRYMPVDSKDKNNLHHMRLFSKLYLDPSFRKQLEQELSGAEQETQGKYDLIKQIDKAHRTKVNQLAKALEDDIAEAIKSKAKNSEIYKLCEEYIKLEHDLRGLANDKSHAAEINIGAKQQVNENQYKLEGFNQLLPKLYDHNKNLALKLYSCYATCRTYNAQVNIEAKDSAGAVLGSHLVDRLITKQNSIKVDDSINKVVSHISREDSPLISNERNGLLYNKLRDQAMKVALSKTNLKAEVKALIQQHVMKQETMKAISPFKSAGGHVIVDCSNKEELDNILDIYEDVLVLARTFPDTIHKILNSEALAKTRAILNAQFIGIEKAEIVDKDHKIAEKLRNANNSYAELTALGLSPARGVKASHLRLEPNVIQEHRRSPEEIARNAQEIIGTRDAALVFSA